MSGALKVITAFHNKILHFLMCFHGTSLNRLISSLLAYYIYDPSSYLANTIRRKLKVNRVASIDEGFRIINNYLLNKKFRENCYEIFLSALSSMDLIGEIKALAIEGGAKVVLSGLQELAEKVGRTSHLDFLLSEIEKVISKGVLGYKEKEIKNVKAVLSLIASNLGVVKEVLSDYGKILTSRSDEVEIWEIKLHEFVIQNIEYLIYAMNISVIEEPLLENLVQKSKGTIIIFEPGLISTIKDISAFIDKHIDLFKRLNFIGFLAEDLDNVDVSFDVVKKFDTAYLFLSNKILDLFNNGLRVIVEYIKRIRSRPESLSS